MSPTELRDALLADMIAYGRKHGVVFSAAPMGERHEEEGQTEGQGLLMFQDAFRDGMKQAEDLAGQRKPLDLLRAMIDDISETTEGSVKMFLGKRSDNQYEIVGYLIAEGREGRRVLCTASGDDYPLAFKPALSPLVVCGDSASLAREIEAMLRDPHMALMLHRIWHQDFAVEDPEAWWNALRPKRVDSRSGGVWSYDVEAATNFARMANASAGAAEPTPAS